MNSILKNALPNDGINSLRKTRTSEVSTFVKNYNQAQSRALRKEVGIWHKDTRHVLRTMNDQQHKLYASLLQLSKARKTIKTQRQDENKLNKMMNESDKKRKDLMARRMRQASQDRVENKPDILTISESIDEEPSDLYTDGREEIVQSCEFKQLNEDGNLALTVHNVSTFENSMMYSSDASHVGKAIIDAAENCENKARKNNDDIKVKPAISEKAVKQKRETNSALSNRIINIIRKANSPNNIEMNIKNTTNRSLNGLILTNPVRLSTESASPFIVNSPTIVSSKRTKRKERLKCKRFSKFDKVTIPEEREVVDFTAKIDYKLSEKKSSYCSKVESQNIAESPSAMNTTDSSQNTKLNNGLDSRGEIRKKVTRKRKRLYLPRVKKVLSDPSEEINTRSSIQAMEGRQYEVTTYRKDTKGNLTEENQIVDTTVDVAKYFHFATYRERLTRQKLLEDSRDKEIRQRKRVSEFLTRLSHEEQQSRRRIDGFAKRNEESRISRAEAIKKGPPKYGICTDTSTPGYVRKYVRPSKDETSHTRRDRKRSSWYLPSIYSLNASLNSSNSLSSSLNSGSKLHKSRQKLLDDFSASSSHLVNMNMEKYLIEAVAQ